jgi:Holliday junction resolvase
MAEKEIHNAIKKWLQGQGAYVVKTAPPMDNGTPDLLVCFNGLFVGIEVKKPGKTPTKIQEHRLQKIRDAGGLALVATSVDNLREQLESLAKRLHAARSLREAARDGS